MHRTSHHPVVPVPVRPVRLLRRLAGCAVAAGLFMPALPAAAAPPLGHPPARVTATSGAGQAVDKSATAQCPVGTEVAGAGIEVSDTTVDVLPTEIRPHRDLTAVTVSAHADGSAGWSVTAVAVCARPPAIHERVASGMTVLAGDTRSASAACPAGTSVIGTGFSITGDATDVFLSRLVPTIGLARVEVTATGSAAPVRWGLEAYAICSSAPGAIRITGGPAAARTAAARTAAARTAAAPDGCPPETSVNGVGAEVLGSTGDPTISGWITEVAPDASLDGATAGSDWWYFQGTTDAYGICVPDPLP